MLCAITVFAQKKDLQISSFRDVKLYPKNIQYQFRKGSSDILYIDEEKNALISQKAQDTIKTEILNLQDLQKAYNSSGFKDSIPFLPFFTWTSHTELQFTHKNSQWSFDLNTKKIQKLSEWTNISEELDFAPNGGVAYVEQDNIYVCQADLKKKQVSFDGSYTLAYGKAAHRSEFGIVKGLFWSNNSQKLAYYRMDQKDVTDYPLTLWGSSNDTLANIAVNKPIKYPMAGSKSHYVTIGIYDVASQKSIYLKTGEPKEQYLTNITWSPDDQFVYVVIVNRDQNHAKLCRYSAQTGELDKVLFEEKHEKYVEPEHGPMFLPGKPNEFVWFSERSGFQHLYHYKTDGTLLGNLTSGDFEVQEILAFDPKAEHIFVTTTKDDMIGLQAYKLQIKSKTLTLLTTEKGFHHTSISDDAQYFITQFSNLETPGQTYIGSVKTMKKVRDLQIVENPFKDYNCPKVEVVFFTKVDGTKIACRTIKPHNFDPNKKYPVFYYLYGGPHAQMIHNAWLGSADLFLMYMASQGYIVFTLDNRGSSGRGLAFEQATFRNLGEAEMEDHLEGVEWLKRQSYVNSEKMAVFGWSFGGFMSSSLMMKKPGTFQVGIAGGPVIDWRLYEIMYTERYMDSPQQNVEGYKKTSLLNYIPNLKGKLLIIHGLMDDTVVPQHTDLFIQECIKQGVLVDYFPYPQHPHNVRGKDRIHLYKKVEDYVKRNL